MKYMTNKANYIATIILTAQNNNNNKNKSINKSKRLVFLQTTTSATVGKLLSKKTKNKTKPSTMRLPWLSSDYNYRSCISKQNYLKFLQCLMTTKIAFKPYFWFYKTEQRKGPHQRVLVYMLTELRYSVSYNRIRQWTQQ